MIIEGLMLLETVVVVVVILLNFEMFIFLNLLRIEVVFLEVGILIHIIVHVVIHV